MADTKISDLAAVTSLLGTDDFVLARSGDTKRIEATDLALSLNDPASMPGYELDYAQITSDVTISGTSSGAATTIVTGASVSYDGSTACMFEFFSAAIATGSNEGNILIELFEDSTSLKQWGQITNVHINPLRVPVLLRMKRTPSAASHTYTVKAWRTVGNGTVHAASASYAPTFLRITRA